MKIQMCVLCFSVLLGCEYPSKHTQHVSTPALSPPPVPESLPSIADVPEPRAPQDPAVVERLVRRYDRFLLKIVKELGLPGYPTLEEIRLALAKAGRIKKEEASWKRILRESVVRNALDEQARLEYVDGFKLPADAEWPLILAAIAKAKRDNPSLR